MKKNNKRKVNKTIKTKQTTKKLQFDQKLSKVIMGLVIVSSLVMIVTLYRLGVLSVRYLAPATILIGLLGVGLSFWLLKSKRYPAKIVSMLLVVALLFGVTQVESIRKLIANVTGAGTETHIMHVIVMDDAPYQSIQDFDGMNADFGANGLASREHLDKTIEAIKEIDKVDFNLVEYTDYFELADDLYDGEVEAIIINEAHVAFVSEVYESFDEETRIIATYKFEEEIDDLDRDVDVLKDTFSVFVTGIDTYGPLSSVSRSDVNMIMTVNPTTNQILLTSIPRDYHVTLHSFGAKDKLTHAGIYGVRESMKTLEDLLSEQVGEKVDIDYYVRVNFTSVIDIVDALGGVEVYSNHSFRAGGYNFTGGAMNAVNGNQALAFVRERYSLPSGDFDRIKNQQALISGIIDKATSPAIVTRFSSFMSSVSGSFELSMPGNDFNRLAKRQIDSMKGWEIISIQLGATGAHSTTTYSMPGWNLYVAEPKYDTVKAAAEMILKMERGESVSKELDWPFQ